MGMTLNAKRFEADKPDDYIIRYNKYFQPLQKEEINLLELGVYKGGSLLMWRNYFNKGTIVGLDIDPVKLDDSIDRIHIYQGQQQDKQLLDRIRKENTSDGFDIIIDDASHFGELTSLSFWYLFENHLKPGGIYVIEDWGTGYWGKWPDGKEYNLKIGSRNKINWIRNYIYILLNKTMYHVASSKKKEIIIKILRRIINKITTQRLKSHEYGMVGFIKQLIDELGMEMITSIERGSKLPFRESKFQKMEIYPGQVFIIKNPKKS